MLIQNLAAASSTSICIYLAQGLFLRYAKIFNLARRVISQKIWNLFIFTMTAFTLYRLET